MKLHPLRVAATLTAALTTAVAPLMVEAQTAYEFKKYTPGLVVNGPGSGQTPDSGGGVTPPAPRPALQLSTSAINFGDVATNTTETRQVLVSNPGTGVLSFTAAPAVSGDVAFGAGLTSCNTTLAAGAACLTDVTFSPTAIGSFNGTLAFTSVLANSPHEVTLQGTAFNPVSLAGTTLPTGRVDKAYSYDFKQLLSVSNESPPDKALATWKGSGTLPAGLSFNTSTGVLSGKPSAVNEGASYTVTGTYKNNEGQQVYILKVGEAVLEVTHIAAGWSHTCAVTSAGGVKCWGDNGYGQLGTGTGDSSLPKQVVGLTSGAISVAAGPQHTCAITTGGALKCWGRNDYRQLGDGTSGSSKDTPVQVAGLTAGVKKAALGQYHSCAITNAGAAMCWGLRSSGQVGDGNPSGVLTVPGTVQGLTSDVMDISAGNAHTCAVITGGGLKCWGANAQGGLGDGTTTDKSAPVQVSGLASGVTQVATGDGSTCAIAAGGALKCWGRNSFGQVGDGTKTDRSVPTQVAGLTSGVTAVSTRTFHVCAITSGGALMCWGRGSNGQLGSLPIGDRMTPTPVQGFASGATTVMVGGNHTCAMASDGAMQCWGLNSFGQLGDGTTTQRNTPVNVLP